MHLGPFDYLTKLGAKWAKLVQKFVQRSRVAIFRNEHTLSTPLNLKLMFWCVSYYLGVFGTVWMPYKTQFKMSRSGEKFVPRSRVGTFHNERNRSTPLDSKIMFWCVLYYLMHLRPFGCLTKLSAKRPKWCKSSCYEVVSEFFATNAPDPP